MTLKKMPNSTEFDKIPFQSVAASAMDPGHYYNNPSSKYQLFVEKNWQQSHWKFHTKESFINYTNSKWHDIKQKPEELEKFLESSASGESSTNMSLMHIPRSISHLHNTVSTPSFVSIDKAWSVKPVTHPHAIYHAAQQNLNSFSASNAHPVESKCGTSDLGALMHQTFPDQQIFTRTGGVTDEELLCRFFRDIAFLDYGEFIDDVSKSNPIFMKFLQTLSDKWNTYQCIVSAYLCRKARGSKTALSEHRAAVKKTGDAFRNGLIKVVFCRNKVQLSTQETVTQYLEEECLAIQETLSAGYFLQDLLSDKRMLNLYQQRTKVYADHRHEYSVNRLYQFS